MAIQDYKCIKVPTSPQDTLNTGTETVGGILIDNDKALADEIQALKRWWWQDTPLTDGVNIIRHRVSLYSAVPVSNPCFVEDPYWVNGCEARIGITFTSDASLQYPGDWKCVGDDCSQGSFIFEQGKSYWLLIERRPDFTWINVTKCP